MQVGSERPGRVRLSLHGGPPDPVRRARPPWSARRAAFGSATRRSRASDARPRGTPTAVEYQVRDARITDVERIHALVEAAAARCRPNEARAPLGAMDLLRQLVYLPNAVVLVADARRVDRRGGRAGPAALGHRGRHGRHDRPARGGPRVRQGRRGRLAPQRVAALGPQQGLRRTWRRCPRRTPRSARAGSATISWMPVRAMRRVTSRPCGRESPIAKAGFPATGTERTGDLREQERRSLRRRGEHLLRGQGGRRGHRLRHAAEDAPPRGAISCAPTPIRGSTRRTRTSASSTSSWRATTTRS